MDDFLFFQTSFSKKCLPFFFVGGGKPFFLLLFLKEGRFLEKMDE